MTNFRLEQTGTDWWKTMKKDEGQMDSDWTRWGKPTAQIRKNSSPFPAINHTSLTQPHILELRHIPQPYTRRVSYSWLFLHTTIHRAYTRNYLVSHDRYSQFPLGLSVTNTVPAYHHLPEPYSNFYPTPGKSNQPYLSYLSVSKFD